MTHLKRWVTGIVAVPVLIFIVGFGPRGLYQFLLFAAAVAGLAEFDRLAGQGSPRVLRWSAFPLCFCLFFIAWRGALFLIPAVLFFWAALPLALLMAVRPQGFARSAEAVGVSTLGALYVCVPLLLLMIIDRYPRGNLWVFFLLAVVFAGDTGAFYVGRSLGRHKLHARVSPGKTWEGAVGGLLASLAAGTLFLSLYPLYPLNPAILVVTAVLGAVAQIGDLCESMIKRDRGVKDSGTLLPGHGGLLDRIDGLLFASPLLYVFLWGSAM